MNVIKDRRWELRITSWVGAPGTPHAVHFYGTLKRHLYRPIDDGRGFAQIAREEVALSHPITADEARQIRRKDDWAGWKEGTWYTGFWSKEQLIETAKEAFRRYADEGDFLVLEEAWWDDDDVEHPAEIFGDDTDYEAPWKGGTSSGGGLPKFEDIRHDMEPEEQWDEDVAVLDEP